MKTNISDEEFAKRIYDAGFFRCPHNRTIIIGGTNNDDKVLCPCGGLHWRMRLERASAEEFVSYEKGKAFRR